MIKNKVIIFLFFFAYTLFPQDFPIPQGIPEENQAVDVDILEQRLLLATSSQDYPVTPGDIYILNYLSAGEIVSREILVESDYIINLGVFGKINTSETNFNDLKIKVQNIVERAYPRSLPSLNIQSVGLFNIQLSGASSGTRNIQAWGLSRLNDIIDINTKNTLSIRNINIQNKNNDEFTYDLLKYIIFGDENNNPYIHPGDKIVLQRKYRTIRVRGEVLRPGDYEIKKDEGISDLTSFFGGFNSLADTEKIEIRRIINSESIYREFDINQKDIQLFDQDLLFVKSIEKQLPLIYLEGALIEEDSATNEVVVMEDEEIQDFYNKIALPYYDGITVYNFLNDNKEMISPHADLQNTILIRNNDFNNPSKINIEELLFKYDLSKDIKLKPFDRVIIPSAIPMVHVLGAVNDPGRFYFSPRKNAFYYINMSGGIDLERNSKNSFTIIDKTGKIKNISDFIAPGDSINVHSNDFTFNFNRHFPIIVSSLTLITSVITVFALLENNN